VDNYEKPQESLGLLPHQIMRCLGLGLKEMASGPNMLWDCVTCYQCQEHCPQEVKVTDILYELKNMAVEKLENDETTDNHEAKV
jgi:heterodisulfide reductase subunit C